MGVKGVNLKINNRLLLSSLILDYMIIRVKEERKRQKERENEREKGRSEEESRGIKK